MTRMPILLALFLASSPVWAADAAVNSERLLQTERSWDGATYPAYPAGQPELTLLRITVPAHAALDWHRHPVINVAYLLAGTLEVENRTTGTTKTLRAGEALPEMVGTVHRGRNPGDEPAVILVFYAGVHGSALAEPAERPAAPQP